MRCASRTEPRDPGATRVTPGDALMLRFVGEAAPTTSRALARLLGRPLPRIYHRVRVLHAHGLLSRTVLSLNAPDRLTLTGAGRRFVAEKFGHELRAPPEVRVTDRDYAHHDIVVDVAISLTRACARSLLWSLGDFLFEREIRRRLGAPSGALVPDGFARLLDRDGGAVGLVIEADAGTLDPKWTARHRLLAYAEAAAAGTPILGTTEWRVCLVASSTRRVAQLATAAWRAGVPESLVFFAVMGELPEERVLRDGWQTFRGVAGTEDFALTTARMLPVPKTTAEHGVRGFGGASGREHGPFAPGEAGRSGTEDVA